MVVRRGEIARELFLVTRGQLSVVLDLPSGGSRRLATLSAGMTFGELAFMEGERRTADVRADTATECHVLTATEYADLGRTDPGLRAALLEGLLRTVARTARRMTDELAQLAS
jgi:glutaminase